MSKCLRCGAGNEWIEPVAKEAKKPRRKRPKVRYVAFDFSWVSKETGWGVYRPDGVVIVKRVSRNLAKRIAAALNLYEAVRRREG